MINDMDSNYASLLRWKIKDHVQDIKTWADCILANFKDAKTIEELSNLECASGSAIDELAKIKNYF